CATSATRRNRRPRTRGSPRPASGSTTTCRAPPDGAGARGPAGRLAAAHALRASVELHRAPTQRHVDGAALHEVDELPSSPAWDPSGVIFTVCAVAGSGEATSRSTAATSAATAGDRASVPVGAPGDPAGRRAAPRAAQALAP